MKRILAILVGLVALNASPGDAPKPLTLIWDKPAGQVDAICIYSRPTLDTTGWTAVGYSFTNAPATTNGWSKLITLPGSATNWTIMLPPSQMFFALTASNLLGESDFSNVAWMPDLIDPRDIDLNITATNGMETKFTLKHSTQAWNATELPTVDLEALTLLHGTHHVDIVTVE